MKTLSNFVCKVEIAYTGKGKRGLNGNHVSKWPDGLSG